jgi:hypothetical protein
MIDGTEQRDRLLPALKEGYFNVDELRFEQLVAMSARLASTLAFYDSDNTTEFDPHGINADDSSWVGLFHNDEALLLAQIISRNPESRRAVAMRGADTERAKAINELNADFLRWRKALASTEYGQPVSERIRQIQSEATRYEKDKRTQLLFLVAGLTRVKQSARAQLAYSLKSQSHDPAVGLLIAFLQLYQRTQDQINRFADRHVDFYYQDCLHLQPKPGVPESVHLLCERDKVTSELTVHRGTKFVAPKDADGQEVVYVADEEIIVTDVKVSALAQLVLERDQLISPECELNYVTRASQTLVDRYEDASATAPAEPRAIFSGVDREEHSPDVEEARIGLAIASPVLYLKEGKRDIQITLWLENATEADRDALKRIEAHQKRHIPLERVFERYLTLDRRLLTAKEASDENLAKLLADNARSRAIALERKLLAAEEASGENLAKSPADITGSSGIFKEKQRRNPETEWYPDPGSYYDVFLTELFLLAAQEKGNESQYKEILSLRAGKLFSRWLLTKWDWHFDWLDTSELERVRSHWKKFSHLFEGEEMDLGKPGRFDISGDTALRLLGRTTCTTAEPGNSEHSDLDPLSLFRAKSEDLPREAIFNKLLNNIFEVSLTTATGWYTAANALVVRPQPRTGRSRSGLEILISLKPDVAPIVGYKPELHGENWATSLPVVRVSLRSDAGLYPYSLFEDVVLTVIDLSVEVAGLRDAVLAGDLGILDPSKPFPPFGPLPKVGSYFTVGSPEVACKHPTAFDIKLEWGGMPQGSGGFAKYYEGYESDFDSNEIFKASVSVLRDGSWQPQAANVQTLSLFHNEDASGKIANQSVLTVDENVLRSHFRSTAATVMEDGPELATDAANGLIRLQLTEPAYAFGHAEYPEVLSRAARQSLGRKFKRKERTPNLPYTPVVQKLSIDYRAKSSIRFGVESQPGAGDAGDKVFHLHPFGIDQIFPGGEVNPTLMPRYESGGNLFIGLRAADLVGKLTLLVYLKDKAALQRSKPKRQFEWSYLANNQWKRLESKRILSDTTHHFVTSGIVTIDVPDEITRDNTILPTGLFWLWVSDRTAFDTFDALYSIQAQALKATRIGSAEGDMSPHATAMVPESALPGLLGVTQIGSAFGRRPAEDRASMRARVGERVRHKNRAQTPWDYERLVLERFPEVKKAKCFMSTRSDSGAQGTGTKTRQADDAVPPGQVVVVVLPNLPSVPVFESRLAPGLDRLQLDSIKGYLQSLSPQTAIIAVSNPVYERIQVRCTVRLTPGYPTGASVKRIEQVIIESISPWHDSGYSPPRFDWRILAEDLEGWIGRLDCVESVSKLRLLHIVGDDDDSHVFNARDGHRVEAMLPGSITIPTHWHIVQLDEHGADAAVGPTGISHMKLGDTLIIGGLDDGK